MYAVKPTEQKRLVTVSLEIRERDPHRYQQIGRGQSRLDRRNFSSHADVIRFASLRSDVITTQESGTGPVGVSVQRTGPATWSSTIGANTFGTTYQNYFTTANSGGVPVCRLLGDGSISYTAGGGASCTASQTGAYTSPASQPPLYASGPRLLGAGALPNATTRAGLIAATGEGCISVFREVGFVVIKSACFWNRHHQSWLFYRLSFGKLL